MKNETYDVIIIGGSFSGLSAAMTLGRALRKVLVIDAGRPANRFTPHAHNFLTNDGRSPTEILALARAEVKQYNSIEFVHGFADNVHRVGDDFTIRLESGYQANAKKLILATGIVDLMPDIPGFSECWGKSVLHCPYCHGYEVRNATTGILGNGEYAFEFGALISNWTNDLTLYTNGTPTFTLEQLQNLQHRNIKIVDRRILSLSHENGALQNVIFSNGDASKIEAMYARPNFIQHSTIAMQLNCELTTEGYVKVDSAQKTNVPGLFAIGDSTTKIRTIANAVSGGVIAGMMVNRELIVET